MYNFVTRIHNEFAQKEVRLKMATKKKAKKAAPKKKTAKKKKK
jgi:hypothetical protein